MKKQLFLLAAILAMASSTPAWAYYFSAVAPSGQTLYYNIVDDNAEVVRPETGSIYNNYVTGNLVIPASVTYNGTTYPVTALATIRNDRSFEGSFEGCSGLTSVTIPNSVTSIGPQVFYNCSGLTSVTIPNSVTSIGYSAFEGCSGLTSVTIPYSVTSIGPRVFYNCSGFTSVTIPYSVTSIGSHAFYGCTGLTSVTIPSSITRIDDSAFEGCSGLTSVTIPNGVTSIGNSAFRDCTGLTSVTIPNGVTSSIGRLAFNGCSGLISFTMGNGVTSIGSYALGDCTGLRNIISKAGYPPTASNYTFNNVPPSCKLTVPCGSLQVYQSTSPWNTQFPLMEEDCNPDGIDDTEIGDVMVYAANGMIYISSTLPTETTIFDITGHQVATFTAEAASIPLPAGVYLVKIGNYPARKVVVIR